MSAAFDEGGARGLLLNHLTTRGDAALVFDSQDSLAEVQPSVPSAVTADTIAQLIGTMPRYHDSTRITAVDVADAQSSSLASLRTLAVCPSLSTFKFMGWQPNTTGDEDHVSDIGIVLCPLMSTRHSR
jgi:condensin complex subunit 2